MPDDENLSRLVDIVADHAETIGRLLDIMQAVERRVAVLEAGAAPAPEEQGGTIP